jgi:hypothetical protein
MGDCLRNMTFQGSRHLVFNALDGDRTVSYLWPELFLQARRNKERCCGPNRMCKSGRIPWRSGRKRLEFRGKSSPTIWVNYRGLTATELMAGIIPKEGLISG